MVDNNWTVFIENPRPDADLDELKALAIRLVEMLDLEEDSSGETFDEFIASLEESL